MKDEDKSEGVNRRQFLSTATAGVAAAALTKPATAQEESAANEQQMAAVSPPTAAVEEMESGTPDGYGAEEAMEYFVSHPGSDFMVDVIKDIGFDFMTTNPGSSFRGLHESVVNYGKNSAPELLTCTHEEQAVAMAHGYSKASAG